jgi:hypothetical protein
MARLKRRVSLFPPFFQALHEEEDDYHFFQHKWDFEEFLVYQNGSTEDISCHYLDTLKLVLEGASKRTLFITDSGYLGRTYHPNPDGVQCGDFLVGILVLNSLLSFILWTTKSFA